MPTPEFEFITWLYERGLESVDPTTVVREALLDRDNFDGDGKVVVIAIGKAAERMALGVQGALPRRVDRGVVVTKQSHIANDLIGYTVFEAGHPMPTLASLQAGEAVLAVVSDLTASDTVIALISGGGSALLEVPVEGVSLAELQATTELLMFAGADIHQLNTVRRALSAVKGGGLRRAMGDARCITLMLSDVLGNDPAVIASGLTVPTTRDHNTAWKILRRFRIEDRVPESVRQTFLVDTVPEEAIDTSRDEIHVIADNATMVAAVASAAMSAGLTVQPMWRGWQGDARELGEKMVSDCGVAEVDVLIGGGEATSKVLGRGKGGRNSETALVAALALREDDGWTIASLASDGDDGNSHAAGAIVDAHTVADDATATAALAQSDSAGYLIDRDALLVTGQSGTNVNDVYIAVRNGILVRNDS